MIRKRIISKMLFAGAALAVLESCSESYPGIDYDKTQGKTGIENQDEWTDKTPILVFVNEQNIFTVKTRGLGAFENNDTVNPIRLANSTFYVYAFRDGYSTSGHEELQEQTDFRRSRYNDPNISGYAIDYENRHCLLDGINYDEGCSMKLHANGSGRLDYVEYEDNTPTYGDYGDVPYNFFAYYMDDAKINRTNRKEKGISYEVEIDGTQDLMCGYAPNLTEELKKGASSPYWGVWKTLKEEEQNQILNIGGYSLQSAHRGIHPMVNFKHQLARLTFTAYPGDETASNVILRKVEVESRYKGTFTVASRDLSDIGIKFDNERRALSLREASDGVNPCEELNTYEVTYDDSMKDIKWYERPSVKVGSSLLVAPDTLYTLNLYWSEWIVRKEGEEPALVEHTNPIKYALKVDGGFEAGVEYPIMIAIYGSQPIQVFANVEGWKTGEPIHLDDPGDYDD